MENKVNLNLKSKFLAISIITIVMIVITPVFGESVTLDRTVYPLPVEGKPLTIYVIAPGEVTFTMGLNENAKVLGTTNSGVFIINYDDFDFSKGASLKAEYSGEFDYGAFDERSGVLQLDKHVYEVGDIIILTLIEPDFDRDSKNVEAYPLNIIEWSSDAGTITLDDAIFESTELKETGNNTGIFQARINIPDEINRNTVYNDEKVVLTYFDKFLSGNTKQIEVIFTVTSDQIRPSEVPQSETICGVNTYLVNGVCKPRSDLIETTSVSLTSAEPKILNTNNELVSISHVDESLFVSVEIENLGDNTKDFVASYRYLASSAGDWSDWEWVSSSINAGKYSDVAIPWNPIVADSYEFDIQIWDNLQDRNIISKEKLIVTVKSNESSTVEPATVPEIKSQVKIEPESVTTIRKVLDFVDTNIDPQHYIDRYNNESKYKEWFDMNFPDYTIEEAVGLEIKSEIPPWVKNIFGWYSQGQIEDDELIRSLQFLIKEGIIKV